MSIATALIDSSALIHNYQQIKKRAPNCLVVAVVKANAYGHDALYVASILEPYADYIAVARLSEAIALRHHGISKTIILLEGFFSGDEVPLLEKYQFQPVIHNLEQLNALQRYRLTKAITVWLKIDTGMHRLGVRPEQVESFYQQLTTLDNVATINLMSHLCHADSLTIFTTDQQIMLFNQCIKGKTGLKSLAASSGILEWPKTHYDLIRPGLILYGISPFNNKLATDFNLIPVMTLKSEIIAVRDHAAGECVGYGEIWCSSRKTKLAVAALGYGDGYPRDVPVGTPVMINGVRYPIVGRISMDMIVIDLGEKTAVNCGDEVIFWGKELAVEEIAKQANMSPYELVTRLTGRIKREYL